MKRTPTLKVATKEYEEALNSKESYLLVLYISGMTPKSLNAIEKIKKICEEKLKGRYKLDVVNIRQDPEKAKEAELVVAPTLIKKLPLPIRKLVGDMSDTDRVLVGLNLKIEKVVPSQHQPRSVR